MNTHWETLTIKNDVAEITRAAEFIEEYCAKQGAGADVIFKINLAVEEALVNTITHGFTDEETHVITIDIAAEDGAIRLKICDDAVAYDPLAEPLPDVDAPADDRSVGGLGVFLIRTTMDDVQYVREDDKNRLTLKKRFKAESA